MVEEKPNVGEQWQLSNVWRNTWFDNKKKIIWNQINGWFDGRIL